MDDRNCVSCGTAARYCFDRGRALSEGCCGGCEHPPAGGDRANDTLRDLLAEVQRHDRNGGGPWTRGMHARVDAALAAAAVPDRAACDVCGWIGGHNPKSVACAAHAAPGSDTEDREGE